MPIEVTCPECASVRSVGNDKAGLRMKCQACGAIVSIPAEGVQTRSPTAAEQKKKPARRSPLAPLLRPAIYGLVTMFTVSALLFRWWFNPPPPLPPRPGVAPGIGNTATTKAAKKSESMTKAVINPSKPTAAGVVTVETPARPASAAKLPNALNEARAEMVNNGATSRFESLLRSVVDELPELTLSVDPGAPFWNKLTLYEHGLYLNAFKFTSPLQKSGDLFWCFVAPDDPGNWYIYPAKGSMNGFVNFDRLTALRAEGLDMPVNSSITMQHLLGGEIAPGQTYIVYFNARTTKPLPFRLAARVIPTRHYHDRSVDSARVSRVLGLHRSPRVEPTPGGKTFAGHADVVANLTWLPNGDLLSIDTLGEIRTWDVQHGTLKSTTETSLRLGGAAVSHDGRRALLLGSRPPRITLWDLETQAKLEDLPVSDAQSDAAIFAEDDQRAYFSFPGRNGREDSKTDLVHWSLSSNNVLGRATGQNLWCQKLSLISGGVRGCGYVSDDFQNETGAIADWPAGLGQPARVAQLTGDRVVSAVRSPDGRHDLVCDYLGILQVFDAQSGMATAGCVVSDYGSDACWFPDSRHVAVASRNGSIWLYDTRENQIRMKWGSPEETLNVLAVSADGKWIASAGDDGTIRLWDASQRTNPGFDLETKVDSLGIVLKPIPSGEFMMGRSPDYAAEIPLSNGLEEERQETPQHLVRLTKSYYLSAHEVTVGQFRQFVEASGYVTEAERGSVKCLTIKRIQQWYQPDAELTWKNAGYPQTDEHPVVNLTLEDARAFCRWLSEKENAVYRLPSEAEWERANGDLHFTLRPFVNARRMLALTVNFADQSLRGPIPDFVGLDNRVDWHAYPAKGGTFLANMYGLSELLGNVAEMCDDAWTPSYVEQAKTSPLLDPRSLVTTQMIERGGGCFLPLMMCRSTCRERLDNPEPRTDLGFRVLREISP